jgi:hypothetical protein
VLAGGAVIWYAVTVLFFSADPKRPVVSSPTSTLIGSSLPDTALSGGTNGAADVKPAGTAAATIPSERAVRVQILNGCGVKGLAQRAASAMRVRGFDVRDTRNAPKKEIIPWTRIYDRSGRRADAEQVADSLGVDRTRIGTDSSAVQPDIDVTVVLGMDYQRLKLNL